MLLQRAQSQSCHSSKKMQQETTKKIYTKTRERCAATTTQTKFFVQTTKSVALSKNGGCCWSHPRQHILQSTCAHVHALGFDVVKAPGKPKKTHHTSCCMNLSRRSFKSSGIYSSFVVSSFDNHGWLETSGCTSNHLLALSGLRENRPFSFPLSHPGKSNPAFFFMIDFNIGD